MCRDGHKLDMFEEDGRAMPIWVVLATHKPYDLRESFTRTLLVRTLWLRGGGT